MLLLLLSRITNNLLIKQEVTIYMSVSRINSKKEKNKNNYF